VDVTYAEEEGEMATAVITTTTYDNGVKSVDEETVSGTQEEIEAMLKELAEADAKAGKEVRKIKIKKEKQ
jgi:hypothetical protein